MVYVFYVTPEELSRTKAFYFSESKGFNPNTGAAGDLYSLNFDCFYFQVFKTTTYQYPLNGYMARSQKPVGVSLERGQVKVHDFGIVNMYQAGSPEIITATDKQPLDLGKIGIVF